MYPSSGSGEGVDAAYLVPYLVHRVASAFEKEWRARLRPHGVTLPRWQVLAILTEYDGARLGQLAAMTGVDQPAMSRVVDQMERDGLARRRPAPDDGRAVEVWLTAAGRRAHAALLPEAMDVVSDALAGIDGPTAGLLLDALTRMLGSLEGPSQAVESDTHPAAAPASGRGSRR